MASLIGLRAPKRRWCAAGIAVATLLALAPFIVDIAPAAAGTLTTVTGQLEYTATDGSTHPSRSIDIAIADAGGPGPVNTALACGVTDENGNYSVPNISTNRPDGTPRHLYVIAYSMSLPGAEVGCKFLSTPSTFTRGFRVLNSNGVAYNVSGVAQAQVATAGTLDLDTLTIPLVSFPDVYSASINFSAASFAVADEFVTGEAYLSQLSSDPLEFPQLKVIYPPPAVDPSDPKADATREEQFIAPNSIDIGFDSAYAWDPNLHEFGHFVADDLGIDKGNTGPQHTFGSNDSSICFNSTPSNPSCKSTGLAVAWSEGVATFISLEAQQSQNVASMAIPDAGDDVYDDPTLFDRQTSTHHALHVSLAVDNTTAAAAKQELALGEDDELSVARSLWQIAHDPKVFSQDPSANAAGVMLGSVPTSNPGTLSGAIQAIVPIAGGAPLGASSAPADATESEPLSDEMSCILGRNGVAPIITSSPLVVTAKAPAAMKWTRGGAGNLFPLNLFRVQYWSADWSTLAYQSPAQTGTTYQPTQSVWQTILGATTAHGNPITNFNVVVVGTSATNPNTGPYRSCAVKISTAPPEATFDNSGPKLGDLTGQSVAISADGTSAVVGSPSSCQGGLDATSCDASSVAFWSYDPATDSWTKKSVFDADTAKLPICGSPGCTGALSVGTTVAMSGDGQTAAAAVAYDPTWSDTTGDTQGPWETGVVTFALEGGTWVVTGDPTGPGMATGVIDDGVITENGVNAPPFVSLALDNTGDELAVGDLYRANAENSESTDQNTIASQGEVDLFTSAGAGDPAGFTPGAIIADPTIDPHGPVSCPKLCSLWQEDFAQTIALSADGNTLAASDSADYTTENSPNDTLIETANIFAATGPSTNRDWTAAPSVVTGSDVVSIYQDGGGSLFCNGTPCSDYDDFATALAQDDAPPGNGLALSSNGKTLLVGNPGHDNGLGESYIFTAGSGGYTESAKLFSASANQGSSGNAVALSADGRTALVGAPSSTVGSNDDQGAAQLYESAADTWTTSNEVNDLTAADGGADDNYGTSVSLTADGSEAIIGAPGDPLATFQGSFPGKAYITDVAVITSISLSAALPSSPGGGVQGTAGKQTTLTATVTPTPASGVVSFHKPGVPAGPPPPDLPGCTDVPVDPSTGTASCVLSLPDQATTDPTTKVDDPDDYVADFDGGGDYLPAESPDLAVSLETPLAITTTSLAAVTVGETISQSLVATGGTGDLEWAISPTSPGALPAGVTLGSDGSITGEADQAGNYPIIVQVSDSSPDTQTVTQTLTLVVQPSPKGVLGVQVEPINEAVYGTPTSATALVTITGATTGPPAGDKVELDLSTPGADPSTPPVASCVATLPGSTTTQAANCALPVTLGAGSYNLTATFRGSTSSGGDTDYPTVTSDAQQVTVQPMPTSLNFGALPAIASGAAADVSVTVSPSDFNTKLPAPDSVDVTAVLQGTGTADATCTATVGGPAGGFGTCDLGNSLPSGTYDVDAIFNSDPNFATSSATSTLTVLDSTTTSLQASKTSVTYGDSVTYTATVTTSDSVDPVGAVAITSGGIAICSTDTFSGDVASCTSTTAPPGADTVTATFTGAGNQASSSGTTTLTVSVTAPPAPPGSSGSQSGSGTSSGTVSAMVPGITASATGPGALTVATYPGNPTNTPLLGSTGVYYDVKVAPGSTFTEITIIACNLGAGGNGLQWWNGAIWQPFAIQTLETSGSNAGCIVGTVYHQGAGSSPTIEDLTGTVIGVIDGSSGDFTLNLSPDSQNLGESGSAGYTVNVGSTGGFAEPVTLSVSGLPAGVTGYFSPSVVTAPGTSVLTLSSGPTLSGSGGAFTVTGTSGSVTHSTSGSITLNFELQPTCYGEVTGTIIDTSTGEPLSGASVIDIEDPGVATGTAPNGTYDLKNLPLGPNNGSTNVSLEVTHPGYYTLGNNKAVPVLISCGTVGSSNAGIEPLQFAKVVGHVYAADSNGGTTKTALPGSAIQTGNLVTGGTINAQSAGDGSYTLPNIPLATPDKVNTQGVFTAGPVPAPSQYPLGLWSGNDSVSLTDNGTTTADFTLLPVCSGTIDVTVYSADTGLPLPGAFVSYGGGSLYAGPDGTVEFDNVPLGVNNTAIGHSITATTSTGLGSVVGEPSAFLEHCGDSVSISVDVHVPVTNTGNATITVDDSVTGQPITTASVVGYNDSCGTSQTPATGTNGVYPFTGLVVGTDTTTSASCQFYLSAPGYYPEVATLTVNSGLTTLDTEKLVPQLTSTVMGKVTDSVTGLPIKGIQVSNYTSTTTDANGDYSITNNQMLGFDNAPDVTSFGFTSPTGAYLSAYPTVSVVAGQTETLNVQLDPQCGPATVSGTIYNASNQQPIPGAQIGNFTQGTSTIADQNGFWSMQVPVYNNQPFSDTFTASATGFNPKSESIRIFCGAHLHLDFGTASDETGTLTGTVTDANTQLPVAGAFVGGSFGATTTTDASGQYTFTGVPTGNNNAAETWDVTVKPPAGSPLQPQIKSVSIPGNVSTTLDFALTGTAPPAPVAPNYSFSTPQGTELTVPAATGTLSAATGVGVLLTGNAAAHATNGQVTLNSDGSFTYTPYYGSFVGADSFTYTVTDEYGRTATGTVSITVTGTAPAPVAHDDSGSTPYGVELVVAAPGVLANDTGTGITVTAHTNPSHGAVSIAADGAYSYTPAAGFAGPDSFTYTITDSASRTSTATVQLTVSRPAAPTAVDDAGSTSFETALDVAAPGVLSNDTGTGITVTAHTGAAHGAVAIGADGSYTYTPASGFAGTDSFTYTITDVVGQTATATVHLMVAAPGAPVAQDDSGSTDYGVGLVVPAPGVLANDTGTGITVTAHTAAAHGSVSIAADGAYSYTPAAGFAGTDAFTYTITDAAAQTSTATVHLTVAKPAAPVANDDTGTTPFGTALVTAKPGVLSNDTGTGITVTAHTAAAHGSVSIAADGSYTYTPATNFTGTDSFTYTITDVVGQTATATVHLTVSPPTPPVAHDDTATTPYQVDLVVPKPGVLSNDTGTGIGVTAHTDPSNGTVVIAVDGSYTYTPAAGFSGPDSFTYTITDVAGQTSTATVHLTVSAQVVAPPPTITEVQPDVGPTAGGTNVQVIGTNFTGATQLTFGGSVIALNSVHAASLKVTGKSQTTTFVVVSSTLITVVDPAGTGTVDIRVTTPAGTSALTTADQFTYQVATSTSPTPTPTPTPTTPTPTHSNPTSPSTSGSATPSPSTSSTSSGSGLAVTGVDIALLGFIGAMALGLGGFLVMSGLRRRPRHL